MEDHDSGNVSLLSTNLEQWCMGTRTWLYK